MENLKEKLTGYWNSLLTWCKANTSTLYIILAAIGALFILPKLYKKFFKKRTYRRRRHTTVSRSYSRRSSAGRGKGSLYMRRKMARLRAMRRKKRR